MDVCISRIALGFVKSSFGLIKKLTIFMSVSFSCLTLYKFNWGISARKNYTIFKASLICTDLVFDSDLAFLVLF